MVLRILPLKFQASLLEVKKLRWSELKPMSVLSVGVRYVPFSMNLVSLFNLFVLVILLVE